MNHKTKKKLDTKRKEWIAPKVIDLSLRETEGGNVYAPTEDTVFDPS